MKYIAITLGPITRTIEMAENTRSLWAASYLFSYIGKKIIRPYKDKKFLLPYISDEMFKETYRGAGVFPDRYIFKSEEGDFDKLSNHVGTIIHELAVSISEEIKDNKGEIEAFLKRFLKVYFFEKDFMITDEKAIKKSCEQSLALLEMQDSIVPKVNDSNLFLNRLFDRITGTFLAKDAGITGGFPTIVKVSSGENAEIPPHPYQRYVAVVKSDGDSMGKAFEETMDAMGLSKALFNFNKKAVEIIYAYKGLPVYIGGDDLLFFVPVYNDEKKQSLFSLLQELDDAFHTSIDTTGLAEHPTLSFGVSISYYKYPMFEALKLADDLLTQAKTGKGEKPLKNNIVFSVQKHSGQTRAALLHKGNIETLNNVNTLVNNYMKKVEEEAKKTENDAKKTREEKAEEKKMLSSAMHGLREKEFLLTVAIKEENTLSNFFKNNYNEAGHEKYGTFFDSLKELLWAAYQEFSEQGKLDKLSTCLPQNMKVKDPLTEEIVPTPEKAAIETAYNALQFIHLVNQRNDEQNEII